MAAASARPSSVSSSSETAASSSSMPWPSSPQGEALDTAHAVDVGQQPTEGMVGGRPRYPDTCPTRRGGGWGRPRAGGAAGQSSMVMAQCRSSSTNTTTRSSARCKRSVTASKSRACSSPARPALVRPLDGRGPGAGSRHRAPPRGPPPRRDRDRPTRPVGPRRRVGRPPPVFLAATEEHERALVMARRATRRHQAGLAHPRLSGDEHGDAHPRSPS